jgi:hypothetical protein
MREVWVRGNRRPLAAIAALLLAGAAVGAGLALLPLSQPWGVALRIVAGTIGAVFLLFGLAALALMRQPRLAYETGQLLVYLRPWRPIRLPIELVECFFLGQGPTMMRQPAGDEARTATIIGRLAEKAVDWKHRDVDPRLGQWCDGYIIIRGTWAEPITPELLRELNARLVAAHRSLRQAQAQGAS